MLTSRARPSFVWRTVSWSAMTCPAKIRSWISEYSCLYCSRRWGNGFPMDSYSVQPNIVSNALFVRSMRPGEHPVARLGEVLGVPEGMLEVTESDLEGELDAPAKAIAVLVDRAEGVSVLIVIDQLEEVFTLAKSDERSRFLAALVALRTMPGCAVVLTLRADFFGDLMESPLWTDQHRCSRIEVSPLRGEKLCTAIARPATDDAERAAPSVADRLLRHYDRVDDVNHAVGLEHVRLRHHRHPALLVLQHHLVAVHHGPQRAAASVAPRCSWPRAPC